MPIDLFEQNGIQGSQPQGRDLFAENGVGRQFEQDRRNYPEGNPFASSEKDWRGFDFLPTWKEYNSFLQPINKSFGNVFHGALQPLLESGIFGKKVSDVSKFDAKVRNEAARLAEEANPNATTLGEIANAGLWAAPTLGAGVPGAGLGLGARTGLGALAGGITGGVRGGAEYIPEGEEQDRLLNAAFGAGTGALAGTIPGAIEGSLRVAGKGAGTLYRATSPSRIAKKVVADRNALKSAYSKGYNEFFKEAEKEGINTIGVPKFNAKAILKNTTKSEAEALKGFLKNPTLKNAHDAQSDLGKAIRRLERINESSGLKTSQSRALDAAKTAQERLRGAISGEFEKSGKSGLSKTYAELTEGYKREVLPYTRNKSINKFLKGDLTAGDLVNKLPKEEVFKARLLEKYPELAMREKLPKYLSNTTKAGLGATGLGGIYKIYDLLSTL